MRIVSNDIGTNELEVCSYSGKLDVESLQDIVREVEQSMLEVESAKFVRKRVFSVALEVLHNMYHHKYAGEFLNENDEDEVCFTLSQDFKDYIIIASNVLAESKVEYLRNKIDIVNGLNDAQLENVYRLRLGLEGMRRKKGAGLGLLYVRRRSEQKIEYFFEKVSPDCVLFRMQVRIEREANE